MHEEARRTRAGFRRDSRAMALGRAVEWRRQIHQVVDGKAEAVDDALHHGVTKWRHHQSDDRHGHGTDHEHVFEAVLSPLTSEQRAQVGTDAEQRLSHGGNPPANHPLALVLDLGNGEGSALPPPDHQAIRFAHHVSLVAGYSLSPPRLGSASDAIESIAEVNPSYVTFPCDLATSYVILTGPERRTR